MAISLLFYDLNVNMLHFDTIGMLAISIRFRRTFWRRGRWHKWAALGEVVQGAEAEACGFVSSYARDR